MKKPDFVVDLMLSKEDVKRLGIDELAGQMVDLDDLPEDLLRQIATRLAKENVFVVQKVIDKIEDGEPLGLEDMKKLTMFMMSLALPNTFITDFSLQDMVDISIGMDLNQKIWNDACSNKLIEVVENENE
jgi:hypothetical protein